MNQPSNPFITDPSINPKSEISRRLFAQRFASAAALVLAPTAPLEAKQALAEHTPQKPDDLSNDDWNEVLSRHHNLLRVYRTRLSVEQQERTLRILTTNQRMLKSIRSFVVQNSDPSACTLRLTVEN